MTVKELIALLQQQPENMTVVTYLHSGTYLHSEYYPVTEAKRIEGYEKGGYVSRPYSEEQRKKSHGYVYIG